MEKSTCSSPNKLTYCTSESLSETMESTDESGWTQYIDSFQAYTDQIEDEEEVTASMMSDEGSNLEWKQKLLNGLPKLPRRLNVKSEKCREMSVDDSLEDTASSPVNSPKIIMKFKSMNLHSGHASDDYMQYMVEDDLSIDMQTKHNITHPQDSGADAKLSELKKKGLCLVPISMVIDSFK